MLLLFDVLASPSVASLTSVSAPEIRAGLRGEWLALPSKREPHHDGPAVWVCCGGAADSGSFVAVIGLCLHMALVGGSAPPGLANGGLFPTNSTGPRSALTLLAAKAGKAEAKLDVANSGFGLHRSPGLSSNTKDPQSSSALWTTGYLERMERSAGSPRFSILSR